MHDTALALGRLFFETYARGPERRTVLDVGALDVNGTLRSVCPPGLDYTGLDVEAGPNVDVVSTGKRLPFASASFDLIVSTSCLEHDGAFWRTATEMARVVKPGGFVYINAPSNGIYHAYPRDCWRFYPDAGLALADWCTDEGHPLCLVESFVATRGAFGWNDTVIVLGRPQFSTPAAFMSDQSPGSVNVRKFGVRELLRGAPETEDQRIARLLAKGSRQLLEQWLAEADDQALGSDLAERTRSFLRSCGIHG
jgi:SAM-dependent methyltransferase